MPTLPILLKQHKELKRLSFAEMEKATRIPKATIAWMTRSTHQFTTSPENVQAISLGLRIPMREVQLAAIESAGLMPGDWRSSDRLVNIADELEHLSDEDFRLVAELAVRLARGEGRG